MSLGAGVGWLLRGMIALAVPGDAWSRTRSAPARVEAGFRWGALLDPRLALHPLDRWPWPQLHLEDSMGLDAPLAPTGTAVAAVGYTLMIASVLLDPHPLDAKGARRIAHSLELTVRERMGRVGGDLVDDARARGIVVGVEGARFAGGQRGIRLQVRF